MRQFLRPFTAVALTFLASQAAASQAQDLANPRSELIEDLPAQIWIDTVAPTERGFIIGNPEAEASLIEFVSYTCGHCADFVKQGSPTLDLVGIGPGEINLEVRSVIRNALDLTVTMLVQCGTLESYKKRHRLFFYTQDQWLEEARKAPRSQQAIWGRGDAAARLNAAQALDLDDMLANQGMDITAINACLKDDAKAAEIMADAAADRDQFAIAGTPSFALDGALLDGVYSWPQLSTALQERFAPDNSAPTP